MRGVSLVPISLGLLRGVMRAKSLALGDSESYRPEAAGDPRNENARGGTRTSSA